MRFCALAHAAAAALLWPQGETLGTLRHGRGVHTCSNGDVYDGEWLYDKRHGRGKMSFVSGLMYEGGWKEDKAHGWVPDRPGAHAEGQTEHMPQPTGR